MDTIRMITSNAEAICHKLGISSNTLLEPISMKEREFRRVGTSDRIQFTPDYRDATLTKLYYT